MTHDFKNLILAIILSVAVLGGWQYFYETPKREQIIQTNKLAREANIDREKNELSMQNDKVTNAEYCPEPASKIEINTEKLQGSISTQGLRFDDLLLKQYRDTVADDSALVRLFSNEGDHAYFAEFGWISGDNGKVVPNKNSVWRCDRSELTTDTPVICS